jgi:hypothetical protein
MFSTLRTRFGIPGVISVIALVFAMFGGAYAASNSSGGGKATTSKAKQGPRGKTGKTGPAGPMGPAGPAGAQGPAGASGKDGAAGSPGANGQSVKVASLPAGQCQNGEGGAKFTVGAEVAEACNGEEGPAGPEGVCSTSSCHLPSGVTETGIWAFGPRPENALDNGRVAVSFTVPLAAVLDSSHVHFLNQFEEEVTAGDGTATTSTVCTGSVAAPTAPAGHFCVYTQEQEELFLWNGAIKRPAQPAESGANTAGAMLIPTQLANGSYGFGAWAVTAP